MMSGEELIVRTPQGAELATEFATKLATLERLIAEAADREKQLKEELLAAMQEYGVLQLKTDDLTVSLVEGFERETLDSKALKAECPAIYDAYLRTSAVKPSVRIKLNK